MSFLYVHTPRQWSFSKQQFPTHLSMKACIWFSENSEFWWFAFVREFSARSKFEYWVSISQFYHLHMFCKMLVHKIHWFFFSWMVSFLLFLICRSALFIIDNNTLLVTYVATIFLFSNLLFFITLKKSLRYFIAYITPPSPPFLNSGKPISVTIVMPFVELPINGKRCYIYSHTSIV